MPPYACEIRAAHITLTSRVRHFIICLAQTASLLVTAFADSVPIALCGVLLASFSCGFGETTYLGLASHYSKNTISTWSSGSGMAGLAGTFSYAVLTDVNLLGLTPTNAMLVMLIVPISFTFSYYCLLVRAPTVPAISACNPTTWLDLSTPYKRDIDKDSCSDVEVKGAVGKDVKLEAQNRPIEEQLMVIKDLMKYMIPFGTVYFMQYFIKQGLIELVVFDCAHSFNTSPDSQYRWYQVFYQIGVFISRSSINLVKLNMLCISLTAVTQTSFAVVMFFTAIYAFIPHFGIICAMMFMVGIVGGSNYANTFYHIHRKVDPSIREFALSTVTFADTIGILAAAVAAIPVHNWVCSMQWYG
ncbi:CLN3 protein [Ancylostoma caninum]|uniref:Battenin n=1 Tax=Ancylostoma caninum TaxID=29170 RepID=A0A368FY92_ANCCA|nr:CLN3 protein [Ancylostoma caninum]